jgi:hypothetical protein
MGTPDDEKFCYARHTKKKQAHLNVKQGKPDIFYEIWRCSQRLLHEIERGKAVGRFELTTRLSAHNTSSVEKNPVYPKQAWGLLQSGLMRRKAVKP